jgi:hypothetical protein
MGRWWLGMESEILSFVTPETTLRCWSYPWVILIASSQNNNMSTDWMHIKFKDWPLKPLSIVPSSWENATHHSRQGLFCPGDGKKTNLTVSFFLFFNKQKIEHQSESNSVTSWTASLWKASLSHIMLREVACHYSPQTPPKLLAWICTTNRSAPHTSCNSYHPPETKSSAATGQIESAQ